MTTEEFIKKVNALSDEERHGLTAYLKTNGAPAIGDARGFFTLAYMPGYTKRWVFTADSYSIPGSMLKLMGELAESKYHERDRKYVILNGKPFLLDGSILTRVFVINAGNLSFATVSLDELDDFAYTEEELERLKSTLPKKLQDAVDMLTVTVGEAKKVLKNDD